MKMHGLDYADILVNSKAPPSQCNPPIKIVTKWLYFLKYEAVLNGL